MKITICTSYSLDYTIGHVCAEVNRQYAVKHGYPFECIVDNYDKMMSAISPRTHCTWYKVLQIIALLRNPHNEWVVWLDADAVIIDHNKRLEELIIKAMEKDLIISENMNNGALLNAGVLLIRNSQWSRDLWADVWTVSKYFDTYFYEKSALLHV
jgi:hypothetical protein